MLLKNLRFSLGLMVLCATASATDPSQSSPQEALMGPCNNAIFRAAQTLDIEPLYTSKKAKRSVQAAVASMTANVRQSVVEVPPLKVDESVTSEIARGHDAAVEAPSSENRQLEAFAPGLEAAVSLRAATPIPHIAAPEEPKPALTLTIDPRAVEAFAQYLAGGYADETEFVQMHGVDGAKISPIDLAKQFRYMAVQGMRIPRRLADHIEDFASGIQDQVGELQSQLKLLAELAGPEYMPEYERLLVGVMAQVRDRSRVRASGQHLLGPITEFINQTKRGFMRLLSVFNNVDRNQAEVLVIFMKMVRLGLIDIDSTMGRQVFDDLNIKNLTDTTEPLEPATYANLRFLLKDRYETWLERIWGTAYSLPGVASGRGPKKAYKNDLAKNLIAQMKVALERTQKSEAQLVKESVYYGVRFLAYQTLCNILRQVAQPDGRSQVELQSVLLEVIDENLTDFPSLRHFYLTVMAHRPKVEFVHPQTQAWISLDGDAREIFKRFGAVRGDPVLAQIINGPYKMRRIHDRVLRHALQAQITALEQTIRARTSRRNLRNVQRKVNEGAGVVIGNLRGSEALGLSSETLQTLARLFILPSASEQAAGINAPGEKLDLMVPNTLPEYLAWRIRDPWDDYSERFFVARYFATEKTGAEDKAFEGSPGMAATYLKLILHDLAREAEALFREDVGYQELYYAEPGNLQVPQSVQFELEDRRRRVVSDIWSVTHSLRDALMAKGMDEETANGVTTIIMCRYLEEQPALARILIRRSLPQLNAISSELVVRNFANLFGSKAKIVSAELDDLATSKEILRTQAQKTRRQVVWVAVTTAVATGVSVLAATRGPEIYNWVQDTVIERIIEKEIPPDSNNGGDNSQSDPGVQPVSTAN